MFYVIGIIGALLSPITVIAEGLSIGGPITLTALFASLLVPFAAFAKNENWQKFCMQYVLTSLFGMYTVVLFEKSAATGFILFVCAASIHVAYWMSSIHSRQYRLDQFKLGFENEMRATAQLIAMLNGRGYSHEADEVITSLINNTPLEEVRLRSIFAKLEKSGVAERALREIASCSAS